MTLRDVGSTLERLEAATLTQLAAELGASPHDVEVLLDFWIRRGDVRRCTMEATSACGTSCRACPIGTSRTQGARTTGPGASRRSRRPVVYEWVRARHRSELRV
ncbi:MAG: FeoC-like transcriptional regulator [Spirochaetota bacterium]